jgi:hypothetical protein
MPFHNHQPFSLMARFSRSTGSFASLMVVDIGSLVSFDCHGDSTHVPKVLLYEWCVWNCCSRLTPVSAGVVPCTFLADINWYRHWRLLVCWLPLGIVMVILGRWVYSRWVKSPDGTNQARGHLSFALMLLYPQVPYLFVCYQ